MLQCQIDGCDERMNQIVTNAIVKYLNPEHDDWDEHIHDNIYYNVIVIT